MQLPYDNNGVPVTDGLGFSLVVVDENAEADSWNNGAQWRASAPFNGSPGAADPGPLSVLPVRIHEAFTQVHSAITVCSPRANLDLSGLAAAVRLQKSGLGTARLGC